MLYNSPRNDQPSAKTSQTSLTDLSLAIGTAYESIHTFVFSHEKSLARNFRHKGSPIVDGPEVYEDRDSAQREAEGPMGIYGLLRNHIARPLDFNYNIRHRLRARAMTPPPHCECSYRPSPSPSPSPSLAGSTMVRGVHRPQAIVLAPIPRLE